MTNALIFFNHNDFFGVTKNGKEIDVVAIIKKNARQLYPEIFNKKILPPEFPPPESLELPWENDNLWQKLNEVKNAMADCIRANHYITPEITANFYSALTSALAYLHKNYFNIRNQIFIFEKLLSSRYAGDLYNLFFWLMGAKKLGIQVYLMSKEEFQEDYAENPALIQELIKKIDIHVTFDLEKKYDLELASKIVQEGKVIVGHDAGGFTKAQFAFIPFMLNQWEKYCKGMPKEYLGAVQDFVEKYDGKMAQLIPPFVSIPATTGFTKTLVTVMMDFFRKIGCLKVIVKGSYSAANRGSSMTDLSTGQDVYCPYILLDVNVEPETWLLELTNYHARYGARGCILLQAVVRDFEKAKEIEQRYEEAVVHKTTVVGAVAWKQCVKTVYYFFKDFWKNPEVRVMGTPADLHYMSKKPTGKIGTLSEEGAIIASLGTAMKQVAGVISFGKFREHKFSDLEEEFSDVDPHLDMAGEFINLISPMGAHALDIVFGKIEEKGERQMYLLEANGSYTRSDPIPVNYYANRVGKGKKTMFDEYLEWALGICEGNPAQAGAYTKKLFFDLEKNERENYLQGVQELWDRAYGNLIRYLIFCNNGTAVLKKPAAAPEAVAV